MSSTEPQANEDIETCDTQRPASRGVTMVGDTWVSGEAVWFSSLIEATAEPPPSDMAMIHADRTVLATGVIAGSRWLFTAAGLQRLQGEARGVIRRDQDTCLAILLADDFAKAAAE